MYASLDDPPEGEPVSDVPKFLTDMVDEIAVIRSIEKNYPRFIDAMQSYREHGIPFEDAVTQFREIAVKVTDLVDPDEVALTGKVFDGSLARFRRDVETMRRVSSWVPVVLDPETIAMLDEVLDEEVSEEQDRLDFIGQDHPQFPHDDLDAADEDD